MIKIILFSVFLLFSFVSYCQTTTTTLVSCSGESFETEILQMDWSVGELVTETFVSAPIVLTQGFHQGRFEISAYLENPEFPVQITVFPNPVLEHLTIATETGFSGILEFTLSDIDGKVL